MVSVPRATWYPRDVGGAAWEAWVYLKPWVGVMIHTPKRHARTVGAIRGGTGPAAGKAGANYQTLQSARAGVATGPHHRVGALREANYSAPVPVVRWEEVR